MKLHKYLKKKRFCWYDTLWIYGLLMLGGELYDLLFK